MLYLKKQISTSTLLGVWKIEENITDLYSKLENKSWLKHFEDANSHNRKTEILATRVLLKTLLGVEKEICYYQSGKPYLADGSYQISISHTKGYVTLILDNSHTMGLDIEQKTKKILKVKDRIITRSDFIDPQNELIHLLLYWSAKEAMFKYLNLKGIDFRKHLHVESFIPKSEGVFKVSESKTLKKQAFEAHYLVHPEFVLVYLIEEK